MAGCRPEYMPILVALDRGACAIPIYGVEHSGNTPGADTLIILNGPIIKELGFNYTQGALRDGFLPNTSVGRFWRLYLRNVAGFLPHKTDKATFGNTWRVVLAENEDVLAKIGWEPNSVEMGFEAGDNTVTIARYTGGGVMLLGLRQHARGDAALPRRRRGARRPAGRSIFTVGGHGTRHAAAAADPQPDPRRDASRKAGWSKDDVQALPVRPRAPARLAVRGLHRDWTDHPIGSLKQQVHLGRIPKAFHESDDPEPPGADRVQARRLHVSSPATRCAPTPTPSRTTAFSASPRAPDPSAQRLEGAPRRVTAESGAGP